MSKRGSSIELQAAAHEFRQAVEFAVHGPLSREFFGRSKDSFIIMEELEQILNQVLSMLDLRGKPSRRRTKPGSDVDA